ncbi:hypothetical protein NN561_005788 [Cricetulus griseus]
MINLSSLTLSALCEDGQVARVEIASIISGIAKGGARRGAFQKNNELILYYFSDAKTVYEIFQRGLVVSGEFQVPHNSQSSGNDNGHEDQVFNVPAIAYAVNRQWLSLVTSIRTKDLIDNGPCLGYRKPNQPYRWISYKQVSDRAEYLGSCLLHKGYKPSQDQFVGIFAQNRPEWVISELACYTYSMVAVPLYDTLGAEAIIYVINKADIPVVICDTPQKATMLIENVEKGLTPGLKIVIIMDPFDDDLTERGEKSGIEILSLSDAEPIFHPTPEDVTISYLPLAHMFERVVQAVIFSCGGKVGFFQGDIRLLPDDMKVLKPTVFPTVPRLLNRVYDKVQNEAKTPLKKFLLSLAIMSKFNEVKNGIIRRDSLWDKLVFSKIQNSLGGKVRVMITGAAPISTPVLTFFRAALGCPVFEAYGQTECTAGCTITSPGDWTAGHVGTPVACNFVKLEDVADMNYYSVNNEGEICIKGNNVFQGYLKDPEKTQEALDKDGWLHTGDIGRWLPSFLVGIVVPDPDSLPSFAAKIGVKGSFEELCQNQRVKEAILEDLQKIGKEGGLKSFEQVKSIFVHPEPFSIENGLLTPTLKAKRVELAKFFQTQIKSLYESIQE